MKKYRARYCRHDQIVGWTVQERFGLFFWQITHHWGETYPWQKDHWDFQKLAEDLADAMNEGVVRG